MEETISLNEIFEVIKKRFKIIIASTIIITMLVAIISLFFITPIYEASSQFIVNQETDTNENQFDTGSIRTNVEVINTYNVIITSPAILDVVVDELNLDYGASTLSDKITVSSEEDSQVVTVKVSDPKQKVATAIANEVVTTFQDKIPDIMNVDNVSILTSAEQVDDPKPVSPNVKLNLAIGLILGLMIGVGVAFLLEYIDTTVKTVNDVEKHIGVPVIGIITTVEIEDLRDQSSSMEVKSSSQRSRV